MRQAVPSLSSGRQQAEQRGSGELRSCCISAARREGREAASSARSKVCARFSLTLSCLQVVTKAELPADCGVRPEPGGEGIGFSLSDFLEVAEWFFCASQKGLAGEGSQLDSCLEPWTGVASYPNPQDSPQAWLFGIGAFGVFLPLCLVSGEGSAAGLVAELQLQFQTPLRTL